MAKIPADLSGASLLGVHNWVKSQITLSNPGSADYTLTDSQGNAMTLSDVARNPGRDVFIEVTTLDGVRKNPTSIHFVPELEAVSELSAPRLGNDMSSLLPSQIDPTMASRIIAEQGLRRGLHTLNRLILTKEDVRIRGPTTAALMQMGEIIKSNPTSRTPFTQMTPINYSSEMGLANFLKEHAGIEGIDVEDEAAYSYVADAKMASKYGLNTDDIYKFAKGPLSDFLLAASANRGLLRTILKKFPEMKADKGAIKRITQAFPQQPQQFYEGSQECFMAHPLFAYPAYADTQLTDKELKAVAKMAANYPESIRRGFAPNSTVGKLVFMPGNIWERTRRAIDPVQSAAQERNIGLALTLGGPGRLYPSDEHFDELKAKHTDFGVILKHLGKTPSYKDDKFWSSLGKALLLPVTAGLSAFTDYRPTIPGTKRYPTYAFFYMRDLGGYYPAPPPKWPKAVVYSVMDAFLENLPYIANMATTGSSNLTPVQMAYLASPKTAITVSFGGDKPRSISAKEAEEYIRDLKSATEGSQSASDDRLISKIADELNYSGNEEGSKAKGVEMLKQVQAAVANAVTEGVQGVQSLTFDPAKGKSMLEFAYDVAEISTSKYGYNMRGDDFKFAMGLIYYSFEAMKTLTPGNQYSITNDIERTADNFIGPYRKMADLQERIADDTRVDDDLKSTYIQSIFAARVIRACDSIKQSLRDGGDTDEARSQYQRLNQIVNSTQLSPTLQAVCSEKLNELRSYVTTGGNSSRRRSRRSGNGRGLTAFDETTEFLGTAAAFLT